MDILPTAINAVVIAAVGLLVSFQLRGQLGFVLKRMDGVERRLLGVEVRLTGLDARADRLEERMDGFERRLVSFQATLDAMRSDLTQVALAVGARPRAGEA